MRVKRGAIVVGAALALASAAFIRTGTVSAQEECHYVDDLNCADIGNAVIEVWDVYDDPYELDVLYGPGNGWTCYGVG